MFEGAFMPMHWLVILVIVLIVFGAGKLPNTMGDLGRAVKEFKKAQREDDEPLARSTTAASTTAAPTTVISAAAPAPAANGTVPNLAETTRRA